jgi:vitamin K-dependent gamma-carboxylase
VRPQSALVPFLLFPLTRPLALIAAFGFHFMNSKLFTIGIFPWLALGTALLFFPPDWPRTLAARVRGLAGLPVVPRRESGRGQILQ